MIVALHFEGFSASLYLDFLENLAGECSYACK